MLYKVIINLINISASFSQGIKILVFDFLIIKDVNQDIKD